MAPFTLTIQDLMTPGHDALKTFRAVEDSQKRIMSEAQRTKWFEDQLALMKDKHIAAHRQRHKAWAKRQQKDKERQARAAVDAGRKQVRSYVWSITQRVSVVVLDLLMYIIPSLSFYRRQRQVETSGAWQRWQQL